MSNRTPLSAHTVVILELALLVGIVYAFRIEESRGFPALFLLTAAGFLVHSFLPRSWRPPFFLALGACGSLLLLGSGNALWLVALSAVLLAVAHLPIPFRTRVMALVAVGLGLGLCRHLTLSPPWGGPQLWPVLASMFMFRLILYMHHIRHAPSPGPIWHRLSYFLMLPNLCFTLFPVIDYSTFLGSYYDSKEREIYQKGVRCILDRKSVV